MQRLFQRVQFRLHQLAGGQLGKLGAGKQGPFGITAGGSGDAQAAAENLQDRDQHDCKDREGDKHLEQRETRVALPWQTAAASGLLPDKPPRAR